MNNTPQRVWQQYQKGVEYNSAIELYDTVRKNENFFVGNQWMGVDAPDLDKPVFNILKRVVNVFIAMLVSDDITASVQPFSGSVKDRNADKLMKLVANEIDKTMEYSKAKAKNRDMLRNACVDGDGCFYMYFDENAPTGQIAKGLIDIDVLDNTNILFGNPQVNDVQRQPHLILVQRKTVEAAKAEAKAAGMNQEEIDAIVADSESNLMNEDLNSDMVTVLIKLWKEKGTVWCVKTTAGATVKRSFNTGYKLYPVAYMSWEKVKNSYHGQAVVTELIPNQIFINKCYAMGMDYVKKMAFPKLIYDAHRLPNGFSNKIGEAIKVEGDPREAIVDAFRMPDMSSKVMELVEKTMQYTKEYMGASDASLGNVRPNNTSAIIAVQKSTAAPLELVRMAFYQFVEETIRIFIDIMRVNYGLREVSVADEKGELKNETFDFSLLTKYVLNLNVNVGASAYWSETMQIQTADNLFNKGIIADPITYLDSIPDAYIKNKQKIIDDLKQQKNAAKGGGAAGMPDLGALMGAGMPDMGAPTSGSGAPPSGGGGMGQGSPTGGPNGPSGGSSGPAGGSASMPQGMM